MNIIMYCDTGNRNNILITLESFYMFHQNTSVNLYVLGRNWNDYEKNEIEKYLEKKKSRFFYVEMKQRLEELDYFDYRLSIFFSYFWAPQLIDEDRIICVDNDVIFNTNVLDIYEQDFHGRLILGVIDWNPQIAKAAVGLKDSDNYINSGVMLMNLQALREFGVFGKAKEFIASYDILNHFNALNNATKNEVTTWELIYSNALGVFLHDQGTLASVLRGKIGLLPPKYNVLRPIFDCDNEELVNKFDKHYRLEQLVEAKNEPGIIHFAGGNSCKPWKSECTHPYKDKYYEYANRLGIEVIQQQERKKCLFVFQKRNMLKIMPKWLKIKIYQHFIKKRRITHG